MNGFYQEAQKEVDTLSRYKKQLHSTNSRLENELEETKKLLASREQVCNTRKFIRLNQSHSWTRLHVWLKFIVFFFLLLLWV